MDQLDAHPAGLTESERDWLARVETEWVATTPGRWYAHVADDEHFMSALYVSTEPGDTEYGIVIDEQHGDRRMVAGHPHQVDSERVVAITLLQAPPLALSDEFRENTTFITNVHDHLPRLLALINRLDAVLAGDSPPAH